MCASASYAKLGLLPDLSLRDSGGAEVKRSSTLPSAPTGPRGVRKGMARIVRDADGNVTIVDDGEEERAAASATPWGRPMEALGSVEEQLDGEAEERSTSEEVDDIAGSQTEENPVVQCELSSRLWRIGCCCSARIMMPHVRALPQAQQTRHRTALPVPGSAQLTLCSRSSSHRTRGHRASGAAASVASRAQLAAAPRGALQRRL